MNGGDHYLNSTINPEKTHVQLQFEASLRGRVRSVAVIINGN
jgi:hypothetical protein